MVGNSTTLREDKEMGVFEALCVPSALTSEQEAR